MLRGRKLFCFGMLRHGRHFEFGTEFGGFGTELDEFGTELDGEVMLYRRLRSSRVTCQMSSQVVRSTRSLGLWGSRMRGPMLTMWSPG